MKMPREAEGFRGNDLKLSPSGDGVKTAAGGWLSLFATYRIALLGGEEAFYGRLRSDLDLDAPGVREILDGWEGRWHATRDGEDVHLVLLRSAEPASRPRWSLHALLLLATLFTTLMAGALLEDVDPLRAVPWRIGGVALPLPTTVVWSDLLVGTPFAVTLMGILLAHEMGHYLTARTRGMRVSPPYFIPFPPYFSVVGTLGAFIRLRTPPVTRDTLLDVGGAGPVMSFVLSVPALGWGLLHSEVAGGYADLVTPYVIRFAGAPIWIGDSALAGTLSRLLLGGVVGAEPIVLHPVAFAGWIGLFVTALNLLPFGQLDGGHVLYALAGERQTAAARLFLLSLVPLGLLWGGWWLWVVLALVLGRGRLGHPETLLIPGRPARWRRLAGWLAILAFFLTFVPVPVRL